MEVAVDAGLAVLCEKPLAVDVEEARTVVERLEAKGARAGVNFPFTSSFGVDQLSAWRTEGAVGEIRSLAIEADFAVWPRPWQHDAASWLSKRMEGGFTREVVSHFLFLTLRQLGPISLLRHEANYPGGDGCETSVSAEMRAAGIPVTLSARVGGTDKPDHNLWVLTGTNGSIRLRDWAVAERLGSDGVWAEAPDSRPNEEMRPLVLKRQLDKVAAMTQGEVHSLATLREALQVQELVETILGNRG
jgi:predicted dehydrogenase